MKFYEWVKALRGAELKDKAFRVAVMAGTYADGNTGERIRPGGPRLAHDADTDERYARKCLKDLEDRGWLTCVERGGKGGAGNRATLYKLSIPTYSLSTHLDNEHHGNDYPPGYSAPRQNDKSTRVLSTTPSDHSYQGSLEEEREEHSSNLEESPPPENVDPQKDEVYDNSGEKPGSDSLSIELDRAWNDSARLYEVGLKLREANHPRLEEARARHNVLTGAAKTSTPSSSDSKPYPPGDPQPFNFSEFWQEHLRKEDEAA